ncbi:PTS sugar transporter subunit IIC [Megalodesulfovibrio gigas]|uniref:PTS sugar transporter subunit IIC n=1 Tax=Megalodesulfovibrio gigas TaxID=879 RepID=UPI00228435CA|nr:PTS sugar transporter subunit IIC [Megalodesulfovibrio gigas]
MGILERPLCIAFLWGLFFGDMTAALGVGIFFELFWLDSIPAGTHIPPNNAFSTILCLGLLSYFSMPAPAELPLALAVSLPAARLGARLEARRRTALDADYDRMLRWATMEGDASLAMAGADAASPGAVIWKAVSRMFVLNLIVCFVTFLGLGLLLRWLNLPTLCRDMNITVTWGHCWLAAALGGALSLRNKRAYAVLMTLVAVFTLWRLFQCGEGGCQALWFVIIGTNSM